MRTETGVKNMQLFKHSVVKVIELLTMLQLLTTLVLLTTTPAATGRPAYDKRRGSRAGDVATGAVSPHQAPLHVVVSPDIVTMNSETDLVSVMCTAAAYLPEDGGDGDSREAALSADEIPYITFYWMIMDHTAMPLTSSIPGIDVGQDPSPGRVPDDPVASWLSKKRSHRRRHGNENGKRRAGYATDSDDNVNVVDSPGFVSSSLIIDSKFYHVLRWGDNKFACKAHTLNGRRSTGFFIVRKI